MTTLVRAAPEAPPFRRDRRVQLWALTAGLSQVGDLAWMVALAWTATRVGGPAEAGLVLGAGSLPRAAVMLWGGALADRFDVRRTMVLANVGRIVVLLSGAAAVSARGPSIPLLLTLAVLFGVLDAVYDPAAMTLPRQMVRVEDLPSAAALFQVTGRVAAFVGAPLGGLLVGAFGLVAVMLVNAASFVAISVFLATALRPRFPLPRSGSASVLRDVVACWGYLRRDRPVRTMVIAFSGLNLFVGPAVAVGLALKVHDSSWEAATLGVLHACVGVGAAVGALATMRWRAARPARTGLHVLAVQAVAIAGMGYLPHAGLLVATTVIGLTAGIASAQLSGAFQATVEPAFLGRTSAVSRLGDDVLMPAAMAGFGALVTGITLAPAFAVVGCLFAALVLWSSARV